MVRHFDDSWSEELVLDRIRTTNLGPVRIDTPGYLGFPRAVFTAPTVHLDQVVFHQIPYTWYDAVRRTVVVL